MGTTFHIEGIQEEQGYEMPCKGCGVSTLEAMQPDERRHWNCLVCGGYGGAADEDMPRPRFTLDVSLTSGLMLRRFLGLSEDWDGAVDAGEMILALALKGSSRYELARTREQVDHYFTVLHRIARKAMQYGRKVLWS